MMENTELSGIGNETLDTPKADKFLVKAESFRKDGNQVFTTCSSQRNLKNFFLYHSNNIAHDPAKLSYKTTVVTDLPFTRKEINRIWKGFNIKSFNKEIPGVSNALALKYSESQGRHYVAERDIKPGEILMENSPYAMIPSVEDSVRYQCCWHCVKCVTKSISCDYCKNVIFCSDKCKKEAWEEYHHVECNLFDHFPQVQGEHHYTGIFLASFRILVLAVNEYGSIQKLRETYNESKLLSSEPRTKGFVKRKLKSDKYVGFINLASDHDVILTDEDKLVIDSLMKRIATTTTLFGNKNHLISDKISEDEDVVFARYLFEKHIGIMILNQLDWYYICAQDFKNMTYVSIPGSFFNHSCVPNAFMIQAKEFTKVVAQSPISTGEQVFLNYMGHKQYDKKYRQKHLWETYRFHCNCKACTNNWPVRGQDYKIQTQPQRYLPLVLCFQHAMQMHHQLFVNDLYFRHEFRKNYEYMMDFLTKISKAISTLDTNAPQPCVELATLQSTLLCFCVKLHNAFL